MNSEIEMALVLKRKDEHFNDFGYQQKATANVKLANSEKNPSSASRTFKQIPHEFKSRFQQQRLILTQDLSITSVLVSKFQFCTVS